MTRAYSKLAQGVLGPICLDTIDGKILIHEHIVIRSPNVAENYPATFARERVIADAIDELKMLREKGIATLVDMTTVDLGRDVELVREVASESKMNVILTTGLYHRIPMFFEPRSAERIAQMFISDITEGIAGSEVKAGIIKCAVSDDGMTPLLHKITEAAAITHQATGAPISTHTDPSKRGEHSDSPNESAFRQVELFESMGVNMGKVVVGHSGDTTDLDYLRRLMAHGVFIGMDRFGLETYLTTADRCTTVAALCAEGYAGQMVLAQDSWCFHDAVSRRFRERDLPNWRLDFLVDVVLSDLRARGVGEKDIEMMTETNPRKILGFG